MLDKFLRRSRRNVLSYAATPGTCPLIDRLRKRQVTMKVCLGQRELSPSRRVSQEESETTQSTSTP